MCHASVVAGRPDPASWLDGASVLKIPRKGPGQPAIPLPIGDRLRPVTIEDMRSIHPLHLTARATPPARCCRLGRRPRQVTLVVRRQTHDSRGGPHGPAPPDLGHLAGPPATASGARG